MTTDKILDVILFEVRENRKDIKNLRDSSIIMTTKFKLVVLGVSFISGFAGSILLAVITMKLKHFL